MKMILKFISNFFGWLTSSPPDNIMERNYKNYGVSDPSPRWFHNFQKCIKLLSIVAGITFPVFLYIMFKSTLGGGVVIYVAGIWIALLYLPVMLLAIIHRKYRYVKSLPDAHRPSYIKLLKRRGLIFLMICCVIVAFVYFVLTSDHITGGKGWF